MSATFLNFVAPGFAESFLAATFLAGDLRATVFFAGDLRATVFFAGDLRATVFLAGDLRATVFFARAFFATPLFAALFPAVFAATLATANAPLLSIMAGRISAPITAILTERVSHFLLTPPGDTFFWSTSIWI